MRTMILAIISCILLLSFTLQGETDVPNYSYQRGYLQIRPGGVAANETDLDADSSDWTSISSGDWVKIPEEWEHSISISLYAYGDGDGAGSPDAGSVDAAVYVAQPYGGAILVATTSWTMGTCQLSHDPARGIGGEFLESKAPSPNYCWAEGLPTINTMPWRGNVIASGVANKVGELTFAHFGATHVRVVFSNMVGITRVYAVMTGRK